ncbi:MAG TPA: potassium channel family protein [Acidimicrobiales bacterium]|nr:potassium channel family protein [Acidimicrobiales bacterium]
MKPPRPIVRSFNSFLQAPASVRRATRVIVVATVVTTFAGGLLIWTFDRHDFPTFGEALWWALQTVTTVGYGDITPTTPIGRVIGSAVLLYSVAFLAILTAAITTSFIEQARRLRAPAEEQSDAAVLARLDEIAARLERLEARREP